MANVSIYDMAREVAKMFDIYEGATEEVVEQATNSVADKVVSELRTADPAGSGKYHSWKKYNKGWRKNVSKKRKGEIKGIAYNATSYQLTHLLEKGHALRNGGRADAFPHIAPVAEKAEDNYVQEIRNGIEKL